MIYFFFLVFSVIFFKDLCKRNLFNLRLVFYLKA